MPGKLFFGFYQVLQAVFFPVEFNRFAFYPALYPAAFFFPLNFNPDSFRLRRPLMH